MPDNWTEQQLDAINAKNRAIIVSAAAGSGKTAVLVEKLIRILSDRENKTAADEIAVVTFTNDAAAQMKQRLFSALADAIEREPENEWLCEQQALIPSAKISTIHSFCFGLIRENAGILGVDPGFRILDPAEEDVICAKAADNVFEEYFENKPEDMKILTDFFCPGARNEKKLAALIPELRKHILALDFPFDFMDRVTQRYKNPPEPENDRLIRAYSEYASERLSEAAEEYRSYVDELHEIYGFEGMKTAKIAKVVSEAEAEAEEISAAAARIASDPNALFEGGNAPEFRKLTHYSKGDYTEDGKKIKCEFDKELLDKAKEKRDRCRKLFEKYFGEFTYEDIKSDYIIHGLICEKLFGLLKDIFNEETRLKAEKNALGFSDAEQLAVKLLCRRNENGKIEKTAIAKELSDYYKIVMIDEFQDSTAVQELIFKVISKDGSSEAPGSSFFAVGDVKQSIYRFRCADPGIFIKNMKNSVPYSNDGGSSPAHILLNRNFRCSHQTVEFVNAVFSQIMSEKNGGIDYGPDESLIEGAVQENDFGPTEIINLPAEYAADEDEKGENENDGDEQDKITSVDFIEAACVASRIKKLIDSEVICENGISRPVRASDICILGRNGRRAHIFAQCLEAYGISSSGYAEESYLQSREISVLMNLLRCIDNPTLNIPMASVLMSPMFMFSAEDMARIRLHSGPSVFGNIAAVCAQAENCPDDISHADKELARRCADFTAVFGALREYAASHSISELIRFIYDKTDYMAVISVYKDSARKKANLRLLPVYAAEYDKNGTGGLSGFVRQINSMAENSRDFACASAAASSSDSVEIKTIHKSKGLEYPFVFLCGSWTKFNMTDTFKNMVFTSEFGPAFRISAPERLTSYESFPRRAMSIIKENDLRSEEMMLLYVTLTRAKYKLFITRRTDEKSVLHRESICSLLGSGLKQDAAVSRGRSMADWLDCVIGEYGKHEGICRLRRYSSCEVEFTHGQPTADSSGEKDENTSLTGVYSSEIAERYHRLISRNYRTELSKTASKLTVSELVKKSFSEAELIFERTDGASNRHSGISAAQAGTAVHAFMQYADIEGLFACPKSGFEDMVRAEADRLSIMGIISPMQARAVNASAIGRFMESGLCRRMIDSEEIYREKQFFVKISEINLDDEELMVYNNTEGMLQGVADCVFKENDRWILVDYKTDRNVTEDILTERYRRQLSLYAGALSLILGGPVSEAYLYSFFLSKEIRVKI